MKIEIDIDEQEQHVNHHREPEHHRNHEYDNEDSSGACFGFMGCLAHSLIEIISHMFH